MDGKKFSGDSDRRLTVTDNAAETCLCGAAAQGLDNSLSLFEESPASLWVLDLSAVRERLDLVTEGHYAFHPEDLPDLCSRVRVLDVNPRTVCLFEAAGKEDFLKNPFRFLTAESCRALMGCLFRLHAGDLRAEGTAAATTARGKGLDLALRICLPAGARRSWDRAFLVVTDITEVLLRERSRLIAEQGGETTVPQGQIAQAAKLASIGVLAAGIAHEINNPNQAILLAGQVVQDFWRDTLPIVDAYAAIHGDPTIGGATYAEMRELLPSCLAAITESASRIDTIVSNLKDYARPDQSEEMHPVDLNLVVQSSLTLLSSMLKKQTRQLEVDLAPHLPPVLGNYGRLEQVCINLLMNAGQALPDPACRIAVFTRHEPGAASVVFEVTDEGVGIHPDDLSHITEPFFTTRRKSGGTGLGLSVAASIVEQHGGTMSHESTPGRGTKAAVALPALR